MSLERISKILELKGFTKEQLEMEAKKSRAELDAENIKLDSIRCVSEKVLDEFRTKQESGAVSPADMDIFYTYYAHLNKQMEEQKEHVDQKLSEVERKQKAMIEAYKQKRLFEILHDKMLRAMVKETSLNEQKETDYDYIARKLRK